MDLFESPSGDPESGSGGGGGIGGGVSRRSMISAGAAAAWSIPLVQGVAVARAAAASGSWSPPVNEPTRWTVDTTVPATASGATTMPTAIKVPAGA